MDRSFIDLVTALRSGDEAAASELVRRYEPAIRRWISARLTDRQLRKTLETVDICQSVLGDFFVRIALGQFELESPEQLIKLIAKMASNKLVDKGRRVATAKRAPERNAAGAIEDLCVPGGDVSPSRIVAGREAISRFREQLNEEEKQLLDLRATGHSWGEIAALVGTTADAVRIRWQRTVDRVSRVLEWGDSFFYE